MEKDYFLGLDMGSGSVGWAVTDDQYRVLRAHGKAMWGPRLFEKREELTEQPEGDWIEEIRELNGYRKFLQKRLIRKILDFSGV